MDHKRSELPDFVDKMRALLKEQRNEIERALICTGEYRLRDEYKYLEVEHSTWFKMTVDQRQRKISRFMKATVEANSKSCSATENPLDVLELPSSLKTSMWEKAQELSMDEASIVKAPGCENAWMIRSYGSERPHYVKMSKSGSILCDDQCLSHKSLKICSHALALATKEDCMANFLKSYRYLKHTPNYTVLAESGKPKAAGKKPLRKGVTKKQSEQIKTIIDHAEESSLEWQNRAELSSPELEMEMSSSSDPYALPRSSSFDPPCLVSNASANLYPNYESAFLWNTLVTTSTDSVPSFVWSQSVHAGSVINAGVIYASPPPLICTHPDVSAYRSPPRLVSPVGQVQQRLVDTPFWLVFIFGNISRCNGCKGKILRDDNKRPLPPPDDIVFGHKEYVIFNNPKSGMFEQSREKRNVYYHPCSNCIVPYFIDFDPNRHIVIPENTKHLLQVQHRQLLKREFNLI